jgi:hypothetical protein
MAGRHCRSLQQSHHHPCPLLLLMTWQVITSGKHCRQVSLACPASAVGDQGSHTVHSPPAPSRGLFSQTALHGVCCVVCAARCVLHGVCCFVCCCMMCAAWCVRHGVCCTLCAAGRLACVSLHHELREGGQMCDPPHVAYNGAIVLAARGTCDLRG